MKSLLFPDKKRKVEADTPPVPNFIDEELAIIRKKDNSEDLNSIKESVKVESVEEVDTQERVINEKPLNLVKCWINIYSNGLSASTDGNLWTSKEIADRNALENRIGCSSILVQNGYFEEENK